MSIPFKLKINSVGKHSLIALYADGPMQVAKLRLGGCDPELLEGLQKGDELHVEVYRPVATKPDEDLTQSWSAPREEG